MKTTLLTLTVITAGLLSSATAQAAAEKFKLETPHTQVIFAVDHMGYSVSYGKFTSYDGEIILDAEAPEKSSVTASIKTDSLELNHAEWNAHVKAADMLNTAQFPEITFKSTSVTRTGDQTADVLGDLTILGVTKPATLKVKHNKTADDTFVGMRKTGFSATTSIKRSDFGLTKGIPYVGDNINIIIEVEALGAPLPATAKE